MLQDVFLVRHALLIHWRIILALILKVHGLITWEAKHPCLCYF